MALSAESDSQTDAPLRALGMMSGTSLDGVDAALLITDGRAVQETGPWLTRPYDTATRDAIRATLGGGGDVARAERALTLAHAEVVESLLAEAGLSPADIDVVGFHGQTIEHAPAERRTRQIGDGALLARTVGIDVLCDFRSADVAAGGEGAPLAPLYHAALAAQLERPVAVLNLGGVANVTWIGDGDPIAFDTGPASALIDDWVRRHTGAAMDTDGALAAAGVVNRAALDALRADPFFARPPPKSLDRDHFAAVAETNLNGLSLADGAATLVAFTAATVAACRRHLPAPPRRWLVSGGGRHNPVLMEALARALEAPVAPVEAVGWSGDALEAQAFAFLAVRGLRGLPLSLPTTTGVPRPLTGGRLFPAPDPARER
jgi:anhydro-N-acetylmuramic acid kinase